MKGMVIFMNSELRNKVLVCSVGANSYRNITSEVAKMLGSDEKAVEEEISRMEEENVICGYPTLINWDRTDCEKVTALIEVKVTPQRDMGFNKVAERIYKFDEVEGGFDLTVTISGKSMKEVARFVSEKLSTLEYVNSTATYFVLKKYKEHGLEMTGEHHEPERMLITP